MLSFHVYFQSKRYNNSVGSPEVRNFRGAMEGRADKGIIITTGRFTRRAVVPEPPLTGETTLTVRQCKTESPTSLLYILVEINNK